MRLVYDHVAVELQKALRREPLSGRCGTRTRKAVTPYLFSKQAAFHSHIFHNRTLSGSPCGSGCGGTRTLKAVTPYRLSKPIAFHSRHIRKRKVRDSNPGSFYTLWFSRPVHSSTLPTFLRGPSRDRTGVSCFADRRLNRSPIGP